MNNVCLLNESCDQSNFIFLTGSTIYNYTDYEGYCYIGYCNQMCKVVVRHYQCAPTTTTPPHPKHCLHLNPPRKVHLHFYICIYLKTQFTNIKNAICNYCRMEKPGKKVAVRLELVKMVK